MNALRTGEVRKKRIKEFLLLIFSAATGFLALFQVFHRTLGQIPHNYAILLAVLGAIILAVWATACFCHPYANTAGLSCVTLLSLVGTAMIIRIDHSSTSLKNASDAGKTQIIWLILGFILSGLLLAFMRDYRIMRRFSYVSMIAGLLLVLSPLLPGIGKTIGGARLWIGFGSHTIQPAEFAKLFLSFFFASYLFEHRDQLAAGGRKFLGTRLPRTKDLGPIVLVWLLSMGVLIFQHDLGTSLMYFGFFICMLYVSTGRKSWVIIGCLFFALGAFLASLFLVHIRARIGAWLTPFDTETYNAPGGSYQLVTGVFSMAAGGMVGTGLGSGRPNLTPLANSDFIYSSLCEEIGLTGILALLLVYMLIVAWGIITAMKCSDGFGKLLAGGLAFSMAWQVFIVVGGVTLLIPLTGLTLPFVAAGGSSVLANCLLVSIILIVSSAANKPAVDTESPEFQVEAKQLIHEANKRAKEKAAKRAEAGLPADTQYDMRAITENIADDNALNATPNMAPNTAPSDSNSDRSENAEADAFTTEVVATDAFANASDAKKYSTAQNRTQNRTQNPAQSTVQNDSRPATAASSAPKPPAHSANSHASNEAKPENTAERQVPRKAEGGAK